MDQVGVVLKVLDGDTSDLDVDQVASDNEDTHSDVERTSLFGVDASERDSPSGQVAKTRLRTGAQWCRVRVAVRARDRCGRINGEVTTIA